MGEYLFISSPKFSFGIAQQLFLKKFLQPASLLEWVSTKIFFELEPPFLLEWEEVFSPVSSIISSGIDFLHLQAF
jgi:hypothetical protein